MDWLYGKVRTAYHCPGCDMPFSETMVAYLRQYKDTTFIVSCCDQIVSRNDFLERKPIRY